MSAVVEPAGSHDAAHLHGAGVPQLADSAAHRPDNSATASARWPGNDKPYRITMGMRPCEETDWLLRGPAGSASIQQKQQVLAEHHAQVFVMTDAGEAGACEAAEMVAHALGVDLATAQSLESVAETSAAAMHPLEAAARLVAEDLVIMSPASAAESEEPEYVLTAAVVCSPSRWDLREKVGRTMREIHQPVPDYDTIAAPTDRFFTRLHEGDIIERTNWTVLDNPTAFQPTPGPSWDVTIAELSDSQLLQHLWLRLERQTLRRLPASGSVLFTILTECARLDEVSRLGAHVMRQLALWVGTTGQDVRTYRGWGAQAPRVAASLEAACSSSGR